MTSDRRGNEEKIYRWFGVGLAVMRDRASHAGGSSAFCHGAGEAGAIRLREALVLSGSAFAGCSSSSCESASGSDALWQPACVLRQANTAGSSGGQQYTPKIGRRDCADTGSKIRRQQASDTAIVR
jgi:hypothetical protein